MRLRQAAALALLAALAACGRADDANQAGSNDVIVGAENGVTEAPNGVDAQAPAEAPLDELAGIKVGKTIAQLRAAGVHAVKGDSPDPESPCGYANVPDLKDIFLMTDGDTVVRIDVATAGYPTLGGVEVGMTEVEALRRLGPQAKVTPHPYTGPEGHYLTVHEDKAPLGLIVETDGKKVESYRIGRWEQVQWIEGCS
jgi:hypothetical protein